MRKHTTRTRLAWLVCILLFYGGEFVAAQNEVNRERVYTGLAFCDYYVVYLSDGSVRYDAAGRGDDLAKPKKVEFKFDERSLVSAETLNEQGRLPVDMRAITEQLGFDPTNHHNATVCPYCTPQQDFAYRSATSRLLGYVLTVRKANRSEWMEGLAKEINVWAKATGDDDRVATLKDGLQVLTPIDSARTRPERP
jgi:hypothetical protein